MKYFVCILGFITFLYSYGMADSYPLGDTKDNLQTYQNPLPSSVIQDFRDIIEQNPKIKQLQLEINSLENRKKAQSKWNNPSFNLAYNSANIQKPLLLGTSDMQNIAFGLSQSIDLNLKSLAQSKVTNVEIEIKILELKNLKNEYMLNLMVSMIESHKNKLILESIKQSLGNLETIFTSLKKSKKFNPIQAEKLKVAEARLKIKQNQIENALNNSHIAISEIDFHKAPQQDYKTDTKHNSHLIDTKYDFFLFPSKEAQDIIMHNTQNDDFIPSLLAQNLELQIARHKIVLAEQKLVFAKKSTLPNFGMNLVYMSRADRSDLFGLGVSVPLPIYGKEQRTIAEAREQKLAQEYGYLSVENKLTHSTKTLLKKFLLLKKNLSVIEENLLPANTAIINLYKHHSTSQAEGFIEFYNALNEKIDTQILQIQILSEIAMIYWNLQILKGEIL
ncbi:MAG: TolC family protein [Helicobacter sp.]|nr:TolC family protein [Helicobacter sp.]